MKISEILGEGKLPGNWTFDDVQKLKPKQLEVLFKNATSRGDQEVLGFIKQIESEKSVKAANERIAKIEAKRQLDPVKALSSSDLSKISQKIQFSMSDTFPDGDPLDQLVPYLKKTFNIDQEDVSRVLDLAVKKLGKYKNYYAYLAELWDEYVADTGLAKDQRNPWK